VSVEEVHDLTIEKTPCVSFKGALKILEKAGRLTAVDPPERRRPGTYADEAMRLKFG